MDSYSILGISRNATDDEIKKAYREKSKKLHPDKGGTKEQFTQLNEAYNLLLNNKKSNFFNLFSNEQKDLFNWHHKEKAAFWKQQEEIIREQIKRSEQEILKRENEKKRKEQEKKE